MYQISQLAKKFNLSRATLIYYDRIGLLKPSIRSESNYRLYSEKDLERMQSIDMFRNAGIALKDIKRMLDSGKKSARHQILKNRLEALNGQIQVLRYQQTVIVKLLKNKKLLRMSRVMDKKQWVSILRAAGLDDEAMNRWHIEFERASPEAHQDFLESLGIPNREVRKIRKWASGSCQLFPSPS